MKLLPTLATIFGIVVATGCLNDATPKKGEANIQIKLDKVGALSKMGAGAAIEMRSLMLTLRAPGEITRRDTLDLSGSSQQTFLKTYGNLSSKKTWTLEAIAKDALGITVYRDSVKFIVPSEGSTDVSLTLQSFYAMLRANFFPIRDSVTRCELWVNGSLVADSSFTSQSLAGDTLTLTRDYLLASPGGTTSAIQMKVYGNWYGAVGILLYEGETSITAYSGQDASQTATLNWVGPLAPIGQGKINVTLGAVGSISVNGYLDDRAWMPVGESDISSGDAHFMAMALDGFDRPHVAFQDVTHDYKLTALRWNGTSWETLGVPGFTAGYASHASLAMGAGDTLYVAYRDAANLNKLTVMRWNGTSWAILGTPGFSAGEVDYLSLTLSTEGQPHVAIPDAANGNKLTVMRWNGTSWEALGTPGFSSGSITDVSLKFSAANIPYVAFRDASVDEKAVVMRWSGTLWETLGTPGFSPGTAVGISMALSSAGAPYVTFRDASSANEVSVMRWNGTLWASLGSPGIGNSKLEISPGDVPYLAIQAPGTQKVTVKHWQGGNWQLVGSPEFLPATALYFSLSFASTGIPYLGLIKSVNDSLRATVMRFDSRNCCTGYIGGGLAKQPGASR